MQSKPQNLDPGEWGRKPVPPPGARAIAGVVVLLLFLFFISTTYYTVETSEVAVVQRFGRFLKIEPAGLHFKMPFGIDRISRVPILLTMKSEFGFRTEQAGVRSRFRGPKEDQSLKEEALMVTGDLNMAMVEWIIHYKISEPKDFLFNVREPEQTLRDATEAVMREVVGDRTVDEVLTFGRQEIESNALTKLQQLIKSYGLGLQVERVVLQGVTPPEQVEASFNEVNQAQQERERMVNEARAEYNKVVPKAQGEAMQKIEEARGYAAKRVNEAEGDAAKFKATLEAYLKAPDVTRRRLYLETMEKVIPNLGKKVVIDNDVKQMLPLLQLNPTQEVAK